MKYTLSLLSLLLLISCSPSKERTMKQNEQESSDNLMTSDRFELDGTWGLSNYFDTIVARKELAKYRIQSPTWFAILLEIEGDSLQSFGSIEMAQCTIESSKDTLATLISEVTGEQWYLLANPPDLRLVQGPNPDQIDSTVYTFRKREDLKSFTQNASAPYTIGDEVTGYFNEQLFKGKYIDLESNEEVVFGSEGKLAGIAHFDSYAVRNYFGTLHPHKNLDVVTFRNNDRNEFKQYHWVFSRNELILTEFVVEQITHNGETFDGDYFIPGSKKIRLKRR